MTGMMNLNLNSTTGINPPHTPLIKPLMVLMGNAFQVVYHNQRIVLYYSLLEVCEDQGLIDH